MQYQTFRGADVQEALLNVREALGGDAMIESTRHVRSGATGHSGRPMVEIVAAPSLTPGALRSRGPAAARAAAASATRSSRLAASARAQTAARARAAQAGGDE